MSRWVLHGRGCALALPTPYPVVTTVLFPAATIVDSATVPASYRGYLADLEELAGEYNWYEFAHTLRVAAALAHDMGLSSEKAILERMRTQGQLCSGASAVLS